MAFGVLAPDDFVDGSIEVLREAGFEAVSSPFLFKPPVCEVVWLASERQEAAPARQQTKIIYQKGDSPMRNPLRHIGGGEICCNRSDWHVNCLMVGCFSAVYQVGLCHQNI